MRNAEKDEYEMRERQERMLKEGFRLFSERSIEPVSMQEVADAAGIGIATLYRYFNTKLVFVIAIGTRKWEEYVEYIRLLREKRNHTAMTAAQSLEFYLDCYIDLYKNHKDLLRFNQNFNNYVQHEGATAEQLRPYLASISSFGQFFHELYEKGKRDGTIRTELPEEKMFAATSHIMLAVAVRYAQGLLFASESEADRTGEYEMLKRMILREYVVN
ncbi:MAG: TetR/AcrR family transcriptional regulator [Oscillospiraceae bacterium]|nr:TetR/AcrR family transcriptional regulator [Oscillospiraceae bacterium]